MNFAFILESKVILWLGSAGAMSMLAFGFFATPGESATTAEAAVRYYYLAQGGRWCAVGDLPSLRSARDMDEFTSDQGSLSFKGADLIRIEEYRTNSEAEGSILVDYDIDPSGEVYRAHARLRSGDPAIATSADFRVNHSIYAGKASREIRASIRMATSIESFPFAALIGKAHGLSSGEKVCIKAAKTD